MASKDEPSLVATAPAGAKRVSFSEMPSGSQQQLSGTEETGSEQQRLVEVQQPVVSASPSDLVAAKSERNFISSDSPFPALEFVEDDRFHIATSMLVLGNVVQLVVEADRPEWSGWLFFEMFFVTGFVVELSLRLAYKGEWLWSGKDRWWAVFDTALVCIGLVEAVCLFILDGRWWSGVADSSLLLGIKMSRLLRIFRVFRITPRLSMFLSALISMLQTFVWVFALLFLFCIVFAIICTNVLKGQLRAADLAGQGDSPDVQMVRLHFGCVQSSFFTLFQLTTQDNWCDFALPVVAMLAGFRLFFVGFIMVCSWTMIAMLTAVASDSMMEATGDRKEKERKAQLQKQEAFIRFLRKVFKEGDADGSGDMDKEEFDELVRQPHIIREMHNLGSGLSVEELQAAWAMLDFQDTGTLTIDAFVEGISYLMDTLSTRHILNVDGKVKRSGYKIGRTLNLLTEELLCVLKQNKEIEGIMEEEEQWQHYQSQYLCAWKQWAETHDKDALNTARADCRLQRRRSLELTSAVGSPPGAGQAKPAAEGWLVSPVTSAA